MKMYNVLLGIISIVRSFLAWVRKVCLVWVLSTAKVIAEGEDPKAERISTSLLEWTRLVLIAKWETPVPLAIFIGCFPGFCVFRLNSIHLQLRELLSICGSHLLFLENACEPAVRFNQWLMEEEV